MISGLCFALFFVVPFLVQINAVDFERAHDHGGTRFSLWLCMAYQAAVFIVTIVLIKAGGWTFFADAKSNADLVMILLYTTYFGLATAYGKDTLIEYHTAMNAQDCWISGLLVGMLAIMLYQVGKVCQIFRKFSLLTRMFTRCVSDVLPFTVFLLTWNLFFSIAFRLMGVALADSMFPHLVPFFRYFTAAFENSMGAISTPGIAIDANSAYAADYSWGMIHVVWFIWFANQFVVTIILMNLLIAVLGDTYANITSNQSQIRFNEEATMNRDYYHLVHAGVNSSYVYKLFEGKKEQHHPISLLSFKIEPKSMNEWAGVSSKIVGEIRIKFDSLLKHVLKIKREQQDQNAKQEKNNEAFKKDVLSMLRAIQDKQEEHDQHLERARPLQAQNSGSDEPVVSNTVLTQAAYSFERSETVAAGFDAAIED